MDKKADAYIQQWREQVRLGGLQAFTYFRGLIVSGRKWTEDDRQGLIDLLNHSEDHMVAMWEMMDELQHMQQQRRMTRRAARRMASRGL